MNLTGLKRNEISLSLR